MIRLGRFNLVTDDVFFGVEMSTLLLWELFFCLNEMASEWGYYNYRYCSSLLGVRWMREDVRFQCGSWMTWDNGLKFKLSEFEPPPRWERRGRTLLAPVWNYKYTNAWTHSLLCCNSSDSNIFIAFFLLFGLPASPGMSCIVSPQWILI